MSDLADSVGADRRSRSSILSWVRAVGVQADGSYAVLTTVEGAFAFVVCDDGDAGDAGERERDWSVGGMDSRR
jgi:hypothetical protein